MTDFINNALVYVPEEPYASIINEMNLQLSDARLEIGNLAGEKAELEGKLLGAREDYERVKGQLQDIPRPEPSLTDILQCGSEVRNQVKYANEDLQLRLASANERRKNALSLGGLSEMELSRLSYRLIDRLYGLFEPFSEAGGRVTSLNTDLLETIKILSDVARDLYGDCL